MDVLIACNGTCPAHCGAREALPTEPVEPPKEGWFIPDDPHLTRAGHAVVAELLLEYLTPAP